GEDELEIETAKIGADAGPAPQPVAVGGVGVEGGINQVEADADGSGSTTLIVEGGGIAKLVHDGRGEDEQQHAGYRAGGIDRVANAGDHHVLDIKPCMGHDDRDHDLNHECRKEQGVKEGGSRLDRWWSE